MVEGVPSIFHGVAYEKILPAFLLDVSDSDSIKYLAAFLWINVSMIAALYCFHQLSKKSSLKHVLKIANTIMAGLLLIQTHVLALPITFQLSKSTAKLLVNEPDYLLLVLSLLSYLLTWIIAFLSSHLTIKFEFVQQDYDQYMVEGV